jgi:hypothetical protein
MRFCYFPELYLPICITYVDFVLVMCFSLCSGLYCWKCGQSSWRCIWCDHKHSWQLFESVHVATYSRRSGTICQSIFDVNDNIMTALCEATNVMTNNLHVEFRYQWHSPMLYFKERSSPYGCWLSKKYFGIIDATFKKRR